MSHIVIGKVGTRDLKVDLDVLLRTRLLIQGGSGSGKSWLLRRMAEQLFGKVPVILIDPEGEFATLREQFGYVLVGKGGDTPADVRSAALLAHKLLELRASAVCDLYEMKPTERHRWVKLFCDALIDAPKKLWQPAVVIVDEVHMFAPEKGAGESEASDSIISLATRGRKRGFCLIAATQRLGKLRKDVASELQNVLIGATFIDIDRERAADTLGVPKGKPREAFNEQVKLLEPGKFFALGRALSLDRVLVTIGGVKTSHPKLGSSKHAAEPPPAPEKVKALLPKLADLPQVAEAKAKTEAELRRELAEARRELAAKNKVLDQVDVQTKRIDAKLERVSTSESASKKAEEIRELKGELVKYRRALEAAMKILVKVQAINFPIDTAQDREALEKAIAAAVAQVTGPIEKRIAGIAAKMSSITEQAAAAEASIDALLKQKVDLTVQVEPRQPFRVTAPATPRAPREPRPTRADGAEANGHLPEGERAILIAAAMYPDGVSKDQLGILTGYKRSTRDAYVLRLNGKGYVVADRGSVRATDEGISALGSDYEPLPTGPELLEWWRARLPEGERAVLDALVAVYPKAVPRASIDEATGFKRSTRDAYLQRLTNRRLVVGRGEVQASGDLFEL